MGFFKKRTVTAMLSVVILAVAVVATSYIIHREGEPESNRMSNNSNTPTQDQSTKADSILIVYLTRTGNTEAVARMIQDTVGGTLISLELQQPYPEDYQAHVA